MEPTANPNNEVLNFSFLISKLKNLNCEFQNTKIHLVKIDVLWPKRTSLIITFTEINSAREACLPDVIWTQLKAAVRVAKLVLILPLPNILRTDAKIGVLIRYNCGNA